MPDKVYDIVTVEMTELQAKYYSVLKDQLALEISEIMSDENSRVRADHVLTKLLRLSQITSGHVVVDANICPDTGDTLRETMSIDIPGGNPKIDALIEILTDPGRDPRCKTIVWANFRHDLSTISKALAANGIKHVLYFGETSEADRIQAVYDFNNDPETEVFVANAQTAGAGLNLLGYDPKDPDATDTFCGHEIFFSMNWSAILRSQAEDRAHRKGTRTNVRITDLMVPGTIDEEVWAEVKRKRDEAGAIQNIDSILEKVLGIHK